MGTRGAFGVVTGEGAEMIGYNQYDSYPSYGGVENLKKIRAEIAANGTERLATLARDARLVSDAVRPTAADVDALKEWTDLDVSERSVDDWYCLTRRTHGDIIAQLECGYILDSASFPLDSLFCEWAYLLNLQDGTFEVYQGFQDKPHADGRFADRNPRPVDWTPTYQGERYLYPVRLVASFPLEALPSDDDFLAAFDPKEGDAC